MAQNIGAWRVATGILMNSVNRETEMENQMPNDESKAEEIKRDELPETIEDEIEATDDEPEEDTVDEPEVKE